MTIHFAAARPAAQGALAYAFAPPAPRQAVNDNGPEPLGDTLLRAALLHFGRYGMGAARQARAEAERALAGGDDEGYQWWRDICRALDRRMAAGLEKRTGAR